MIFYGKFTPPPINTTLGFLCHFALKYINGFPFKKREGAVLLPLKVLRQILFFKHLVEKEGDHLLLLLIVITITRPTKIQTKTQNMFKLVWCHLETNATDMYIQEFQITNFGLMVISFSINILEFTVWVIISKIPIYFVYFAKLTILQSHTKLEHKQV
jgi:hypothetical protein